MRVDGGSGIPEAKGGTMDETTTRELTDEDIRTVMPGTAINAERDPDMPGDTDGQDAGDGTDGDATDGKDGDATDGRDADGTDSGDMDGTDSAS
jgi:hypothetical protein